jgi:hypothetical protein
MVSSSNHWIFGSVFCNFQMFSTFPTSFVINVYFHSAVIRKHISYYPNPLNVLKLFIFLFIYLFIFRDGLAVWSRLVPNSWGQVTLLC